MVGEGGADVELPGSSVFMPACENMISGAMAMMGEMLTPVSFAYHERGSAESARWEQSECDMQRHARHDDSACLVEVVGPSVVTPGMKNEKNVQHGSHGLDGPTPG